LPESAGFGVDARSDGASPFGVKCNPLSTSIGAVEPASGSWPDRDRRPSDTRRAQRRLTACAAVRDSSQRRNDEKHRPPASEHSRCPNRD
jgi:hypothetical protein